MSSFFKFVAGVLLTALIVTFSLVRIAFEIIGASTAPDDFELLKSRMPKVLEWLFTTPWMVPTAIVVVTSFGAAWLLLSATRKATSDEIAEHAQLDESSIVAIVKREIHSLAAATPSHDSQAIAEIKGKLERLQEPNPQPATVKSDEFRLQIASLYDALGAIYHRERLFYLAQGIEAGGKELGAPTRDKAILDEKRWEEWRRNERGWQAALKEWCDLASCYVNGIDVKVLTVTPEQYEQEGEATASQFPGEGYIVYKRFWAQFKNWRDWQEEVKRAVHQVAFNGGTAGSRPIFPGGGYLEDLGARNG